MSSRQITQPETESELASESCPDCGGNVLPSSDGHEFVCDECGLIVNEDRIDHGPEWRSFKNGDGDGDGDGDKSRVGDPRTVLLHDEGLSTDISWNDKDGYGNPLSQKKQNQFRRLRKHNQWSKTQDHKERNLRKAITEINRMASALGLPKSVRETASVVFRQYHNQTDICRSLEEVAAACLYAATKQCNCPRTLNDLRPVCRGISVGQSNDESKSGIGRTYRDICRELGLEIEPTRAEQFFDRLISGIGIDSEYQPDIRSDAKSLLDNLRSENLHSGSAPISLAAGVVYCACRVNGIDIKQKTAADAASVSKMTIRNRYKDIVSVSDLDRCDIVPEEHV